METNRKSLWSPGEINREVIRCRRCPRLVEWREEVARKKTRRFADWDYWGKPVPGFGDTLGRLLIIGLAPAAHGANRTGRMFTGDRSGDWLYRALYRTGFANQPESTHREDGLQLKDCYITALCRCAPPANKPTREEFANCAPFLRMELEYFQYQWESNGKGAILCLGQLSLNHTLRLLEEMGWDIFKPRPKFKHGMEIAISSNLRLFASYHPSQQNTFTRRLTEEMLDAVFTGIRRYLAEGE